MLGADAILLIVSLMDGSQLADYVGLAGELQMAALVEVHDAGELTAQTGRSAADRCE